MNRSTSIIAALLFLLCSALTAQTLAEPPEDLGLSGLSPTYVSLLLDEEYSIGDVERSHFALTKSVVGQDGSLYAAYVQVGAGFHGSYIVKYDTDTGTYLWKKSLTPAITSENYVLVQDLRERSDGQLELFGCLVNDGGFVIDPTFGNSIRIILDSETGEIRDHFFIEPLAPGATYAGSFGQTWNQFFTFEEDELYAQTHPNLTDSLAIQIRLLTPEFGATSDTTFIAPPDVDFWSDRNAVIRLTQPYALGDGRYILPVVYDARTTDESQSELLWIGPTGQVERRVNLSSQFSDSQFLYIKQFGEDGYIVSGSHDTFETGTAQQSTYFAVLDKQGEVILSNERFSVGGDVFGTAVFEYYNDSTLLVFASLASSNVINVLTLQLDGSAESLATLEASDPAINLIPSELSKSEDKYLTHLFVTRDSIITNSNGDPRLISTGSWIYFMNFDAEELGAQVVSTDQQIVRSPKINLAPNPTSDWVTVTCNEPFNGQIRLFDQNGRVHFERPIEGVQEARFDLGGLANGTYFLQVQDHRGVLLSRKLLKVE